jgi:hypothetical protein
MKQKPGLHPPKYPAENTTNDQIKLICMIHSVKPPFLTSKNTTKITSQTIKTLST